MLDKQYGKFVLECDVCGDTLETNTSDFNEARAVMQREGWKARGEGQRPNVEWIHACAKCGKNGVPEFGLFARQSRGSRR